MKYILFDLDGTLTDPKIGITTSVAYALEHLGIKTDNLDDLCRFIGPPLIDTFRDDYNLSPEDVKYAIAKYRERFSVKGLYENMLYDGIKELLMQLAQRGDKIILATSKPTIYAKKILEHFDIAQYFTFVSGSELDGSRDDKGEVIAYALEQNNVTDISQLVMVGDRKYDVIGAKQHGIKTIAVLYGYGDIQELTDAGADVIVETVKELETILMR